MTNVRKWIQIVESAMEGELTRLADLARQCDSVEQFIKKTDGMDVLYRGHYDDQTDNNVFMTDYVGHAAEYVDDSGRIDAFAFDPHDDVFLYNDAHFDEMRNAYRQLSPKQFADLYRSALTGNRFANQLMNRSVLAKVRRVIQGNTPYSDFSGNHELNDLLVPLLQKYALDTHGKNIIAFMGNDYADYGGQMEFVVGDVSKLVDLRELYANVKAES